MKKNKIMALAVIASALIIVIGSIAISYASDTASSAAVTSSSTTATPGSAEDPIVTKSYVDKAVEEVKNSQSGSSETAASAWEAVHVDAGKSVMGGQGTEIILRSGQASAIDNGSNGVSDLTGAADLMSGDNVVQNHLLLIPRNDGRGVKCSTDCWFMILGTYEIK